MSQTEQTNQNSILESAEEIEQSLIIQFAEWNYGICMTIVGSSHFISKIYNLAFDNAMRTRRWHVCEVISKFVASSAGVFGPVLMSMRSA